MVSSRSARVFPLLALLLLAGCYAAIPEISEEPPASQRRGERRQMDTRSTPSVERDEPAAPSDELDPRWIIGGELVNARDLGGTPAADERSIAFRVLFRGPPPARLTEGGCEEFAALGIRTVIDLRVESERASVPQSACVHDLAEVVSAPLPIPYRVSGQDYITILNTTESMAEIFRRLGDDTAYPIYFHCTYGRDRTGVVAAAILQALGTPREAILREYLLSQSTVGAYPLSLEVALDSIEAAGGIGAYLSQLGVTESQLSTLREIALGE